MAKTLNVSRADAYTAVADVWAMLAAEAEGDIVNGWTLEMLDAVVEMEMAGCGSVMLQAGLVGVVDDGLVLPAELRHQQRDERGGGAAADDHPSDSRRKALNAEAARRYRRKTKVTGSKAKPAGKSYRTLGFVAGHEIRVFDGRYGPYAMLLGATLGGQAYKKLTAGAKDKSLETVTLADVLPGIVEKWKDIHDRERKIHDPGKRKALVPPYDALRSAADHHHDGDDASCRHDDASSLASSSRRQAAGDNSSRGSGLDAAGASSTRHDDGVSSMSSTSLSLSSLEEKREREEREESEIKSRRLKLGILRRIRFDKLCSAALDRWFVVQFVSGEDKKVPDPDAIAADIGLTREEVMSLGGRECWSRFRRQTLEGIESAANDIPARSHHESGEDIGAVEPATDPGAGEKPAAGSVGARDGDEPAHEELTDVQRLRQSCDTLRAARDQGVTLTVKTVNSSGDHADVQPLVMTPSA